MGHSSYSREEPGGEHREGKGDCTQRSIFIHPYDDKAVIAGQGTIALEILRDLPETDMIVVPVGGGGLIAGISNRSQGNET